MAARWEHFAHDADMGIRGLGATRDEAFEQAALAMIAVAADLAAVAALEAVSIECAAPDAELLLVDWLNGVIYEMATRRMLFRRFHVRIDEAGPGELRLRAQAWGERIDPARHGVAVEIKGATYTALRVAQDGGEWLAQTVVDV